MSENFIEASREKVKQLMERPLGELRLCAVLIDGTPFKDRQMIVALGIGCDGRKTVLGIREGATENAAVVSALLSELVERGLDFSTPRLYILDGGKALHAAVRRHAGEAAFIQRCQVHKKRNVVDHLPDEHKADVKKKLQNAYAMADYADAKRALERLHRELMDLNPSAARSLEEGMEETLTVHKLRVPDSAPPDPGCTNVIESAFSIVETVCRNVKRWRAGDQIERWVGSGLLVAERQFRKVHRPSPDSAAAVLDGQCRFQETDCEGSRRRVVYEGRESLTFNEVPGNFSLQGIAVQTISLCHRPARSLRAAKRMLSTSASDI